jgi:hypothetical protein
LHSLSAQTCTTPSRRFAADTGDSVFLLGLLCLISRDDWWHGKPMIEIILNILVILVMASPLLLLVGILIIINPLSKKWRD